MPPYRTIPSPEEPGFSKNYKANNRTVGRFERSKTQKIKVRNKGNVGFRHLNPTTRSAIALLIRLNHRSRLVTVKNH